MESSQLKKSCGSGDKSSPVRAVHDLPVNLTAVSHMCVYVLHIASPRIHFNLEGGSNIQAALIVQTSEYAKYSSSHNQDRTIWEVLQLCNQGSATVPSARFKAIQHLTFPNLHGIDIMRIRILTLKGYCHEGRRLMSPF
ncbi:unnamed protein product [Somion occarium]|uniref:Uncharacterized protein n=1 Tax=Somion occarium TaxID=3059160 RepID=A0ABP1DDR3_9APHY